MPTLTLDQARHEANIAARAKRLFTTEGYTYRKFATNDTVYSVMPADKTRDGYIVDTEFHTCSCKGHELTGLCSHRLAIEEIAASEAAAQVGAGKWDKSLPPYAPSSEAHGLAKHYGNEFNDRIY